MTNPADYRYDVFVSHSDADRAWVRGYLLPALGLPSERVITPHDFRPGAPVVAEFERAVTDSRTTVLVFSPAYLADEWSTFSEQLTSYASVADQRDRLIPLLLRPCTLPLRVDFRVRLDCTDEANWEQETARLRALLDQPEPTPERIPCPYPGMVPFSEADSDRFFGRDREVQELLERLRLHPFVTVIGPSGSGKSSLVFAGLVPALRKSGLFGPGGWLVRTLRPGESPLAALVDALDGDPADAPRAVSELLATQPDARRLLLVVDQFEELFTLARSDVESFQQALLRLAETPNCYVVLTVRADFYPDLMAAPLWRQIQAHRFEVLPPDEDGLRQAIVRPAEDAGVFVEEGLVERLLADAAGEPGILPLLQETLVLLWGRLQRRFLPLDAYEALGDAARTGLQVAMARRADAALAELTEGQQAIARRIFLRLVQFGEGRADTRRQQPVAALRAVGDDPHVFNRTLEYLTGNRLLTLSGEEGGDGRQVDMAHEALIRGWPRLKKWVDKDRAGLRIHRRLTEAAAEWERKGYNKDYLYRGTVLAEANKWVKRHKTDLTQREDQFLRASRRAMYMRPITLLTIILVVAAVAVVLEMTTGLLRRVLYPPLPMDWVEVSAGEFWMGSSDADIDQVQAPEICPSCDVSHEQPQHRVFLDTYWIGRYEVTKEQYHQCVRVGECGIPNDANYDAPEFADHPIVGVDWEDARTFCEWNGGGRLPSEAEWEKAARGAVSNAKAMPMYPWGDEQDPQKANVDRGDAGRTESVGSYSPAGDSPYGASDMTGNAWEWVMDWYDQGYYSDSPDRNPAGPGSGIYRVLRGGSFENSWVDARPAYRFYYPPSNASKDVGFRCVRQ